MNINKGGFLTDESMESSIDEDAFLFSVTQPMSGPHLGFEYRTTGRDVQRAYKLGSMRIVVAGRGIYCLRQYGEYDGPLLLQLLLPIRKRPDDPS